MRNNGAIGAILDEYEKAIAELKSTIRDLSATQLTTKVDFKTEDKDCQSIQSILSHVVRSGYTYAILVRKQLNEIVSFKEYVYHDNVESYIVDLDNMFNFNEKLFSDHPNLSMSSLQGDSAIQASWGTVYDLEQLFEHAIVHILRHRRQIGRFKQILEDQRSTL